MFKCNLLFKSRYFASKISFSNNYSTSISSIFKENNVGGVVTVKGWIKSLRNQKQNIFFDVSDGSTSKKLQICLPKGQPELARLSVGASVVATGLLSLSPKGAIELLAQDVQICGGCVISDGYPFAPRKQYATEYVRQFLHFRPRTNKFSALLRIRHNATLAFHDFFHSEKFINVHTPILTSNDCEGAGEVFKVIPENKALVKTMQKEGQMEDEVYFNRKCFLTVSGQLHLEAAAHSLKKVYTFGPTFRAENSRSRLHLSEFYMIEAEKAFIDKIDDLTSFVQTMLQQTTRNLIDSSGDDLEVCSELKNDFKWVNSDFPVITYQEAVNILEKNREKFKENYNGINGFAKEHELFLVQYHNNVPTFVVDWPKDMKPFYMKANGGDTVFAFDLLAPVVGEIVGGSLRENHYGRLKEKLPKNTNLDWYLELRKFGSVPTGGFGLGFERYLQTILGVANIKDVIAFPRWPHNCNL